MSKDLTKEARVNDLAFRLIFFDTKLPKSTDKDKTATHMVHQIPCFIKKVKKHSLLVFDVFNRKIITVRNTEITGYTRSVDDLRPASKINFHTLISPKAIVTPAEYNREKETGRLTT